MVEAPTPRWTLLRQDGGREFEGIDISWNELNQSFGTKLTLVQAFNSCCLEACKPDWRMSRLGFCGLRTYRTDRCSRGKGYRARPSTGNLWLCLLCFHSFRVLKISQTNKAGLGLEITKSSRNGSKNSYRGSTRTMERILISSYSRSRRCVVVVVVVQS